MTTRSVRTSPRAWSAGVLVAAAAVAPLAACGGDLVLPDPAPAAEPARLEAVRGNDQTGRVGEALADPLVVRATTETGQPVEGSRVAFLTANEAAGTTIPDTAATDGAGEAATRWMLGTAAGRHRVEARLVSDEGDSLVVPFEAVAVAADPDSLEALSPLNQPGRRRRTLPDPIVVRVLDRFGNPVEGVAVAWDVTAGAGEVREAQTVTGAGGTASARWRLGDEGGVHRLVVSVAGEVRGSPVTFTAVVLF